jgi:hypothetical protein
VPTRGRGGGRRGVIVGIQVDGLYDRGTGVVKLLEDFGGKGGGEGREERRDGG